MQTIFFRYPLPFSKISASYFPAVRDRIHWYREPSVFREPVKQRAKYSQIFRIPLIALLHGIRGGQYAVDIAFSVIGLCVVCAEYVAPSRKESGAFFVAHAIGKAVKFGIVCTVHFRKCHGAGSVRNAGIVGDDHLSAGFQNASAFFAERLGVEPVERLRGGDVIDTIVRKMRIGGGTVYGGEMFVPRQLFFRFSSAFLRMSSPGSTACT